MTLKLSTVDRNARLDAHTSSLNGGTRKVYTGTQPANPQAGASGTLLATFTFGSPAFGAAGGGSATANAITGVAAAATGTAEWFRDATSVGTTICDGRILQADDAAYLLDPTIAEMVLDNVALVAGQTVNIGSIVKTQKELGYG